MSLSSGRCFQFTAAEEQHTAH